MNRGSQIMWIGIPLPARRTRNVFTGFRVLNTNRPFGLTKPPGLYDGKVLQARELSTTWQRGLRQHTFGVSYICKQNSGFDS